MGFFLLVFLLPNQVSFSANRRTSFAFVLLCCLWTWLWRPAWFIASNVLKDFISFSFHEHMREIICWGSSVCLFVCFQIGLLFRMARWMSCMSISPETAYNRGLVLAISVAQSANSHRMSASTQKKRTGSTSYPWYVALLLILDW